MFNNKDTLPINLTSDFSGQTLTYQVTPSNSINRYSGCPGYVSASWVITDTYLSEYIILLHTHVKDGENVSCYCMGCRSLSLQDMY